MKMYEEFFFFFSLTLDTDITIKLYGVFYVCSSTTFPTCTTLDLFFWLERSRHRGTHYADPVSISVGSKKAIFSCLSAFYYLGISIKKNWPIITNLDCGGKAQRRTTSRF